MKYLIMPIFRLVWVIIAIALAPVVFAVGLLLDLWHWEFESTIGAKEIYFDRFSTSDNSLDDWLYKNPWHYLIGKKTSRYD